MRCLRALARAAARVRGLCWRWWWAGVWARVARWGFWRCRRGFERAMCVRAWGSSYWVFGCRGAATGGGGRWRRPFSGCVARSGARSRGGASGGKAACVRPRLSGYFDVAISGRTEWRGRVGDGDGEGECDELTLDVVCVGRESETCREGRRSETGVLVCEMVVVALARRCARTALASRTCASWERMSSRRRALGLGFGQLRGGARRARA